MSNNQKGVLLLAVLIGLSVFINFFGVAGIAILIHLIKEKRWKPDESIDRSFTTSSLKKIIELNKAFEEKNKKDKTCH